MEPRLTFDPELIPLSSFDFWAGMTQTRFYRIKIESRYKTATGDKVMQLFIPRAQILSTTISEDENKLYNELVMRPIRNIDKEIPVVTCLDNTDGVTEIAWDGSDLTDAQKAEAMWYLIIGETYRA